MFTIFNRIRKKAYLKIRATRRRLTSGKMLFSNIYESNYWEGTESKSGWGSSLVQTRRIREQLPALINELNIRSFLDVPCGDFNWMKEVNLRVEEYIGADIVYSLVESDQRKYGSRTRRFVVLDVTRDKLPRVDLIFCRDCLVHFSYKDIRLALQRFHESTSIYLLTTTFTNRNKNEDIVTGEWRPLNLQIAPFNFPRPSKLINEHCTEDKGRFTDKSLGLWKISDLPIWKRQPYV